MSDLKEYLELKRQYEKLDTISNSIRNITLNCSNKDVVNTNKALKQLDELSGWFLVKIDDLEEQANE